MSDTFEQLHSTADELRARLQQNASEKKRKAPPPQQPPPRFTTPEQASRELNEKLGLRDAAYYKERTQTVGILGKRLKLIHKYIEERCDDGEFSTILPASILTSSVRAALLNAQLRVSDEAVEADCCCGETPCAGFAAGCTPEGYTISWA